MRIFGRKPALDDVQRAELRDTATRWITPGFRTRDRAVEELLEYHDDLEVPDAVLTDVVRQVVDEVWRDRLAEEATWSDTGDFGRLERAFTTLGQQRLVARMDFACCQTCGTTEIDDERTPRAEATEGEYPYEEWAYTFFHQQDSERLAERDAVLYLSYSSFGPADDVEPELMRRAIDGDEEARRDVMAFTDAKVGSIVRDALVAEGLDVEWNGTAAQRIAVHVPGWRKPLPRG